MCWFVELTNFYFRRNKLERRHLASSTNNNSLARADTRRGESRQVLSLHIRVPTSGPEPPPSGAHGERHWRCHPSNGRSLDPTRRLAVPQPDESTCIRSAAPPKFKRTGSRPSKGSLHRRTWTTLSSGWQRRFGKRSVNPGRNLPKSRGMQARSPRSPCSESTSMHVQA